MDRDVQKKATTMAISSFVTFNGSAIRLTSNIISEGPTSSWYPLEIPIQFTRCPRGNKV